MKKTSGSFLKISVYRRRFTGTVCSIIFISLFCLIFALCFFTTIWADNRWQEVQSSFMTLEQQKRDRSEQLENYVNGIYAKPSLMEDTKTLFESTSEQDYTRLREENSARSNTQIAWLPGDMRKLFVNSQLKVNAVTVRSPEGLKIIWLDNLSGNMRVTYGLRGEWQLIDRTDRDTVLESFEVRSPDSVMKSLGTLTFYGSSKDIYKGSSQAYDWALIKGKMISYENVKGEREREWILTASEKEAFQGWFLWKGRLPVFHFEFVNSSGDSEYISAVDIVSLWRANGAGAATLAVTVLVLAAGAVVVAFFNLQSEARFLSHIMDMLKTMEHGSFVEVGTMVMKRGGHYNEYTLIADALSEVSVKLDGYIRKEYLLKLKQQETAMRALRHQINPHFLYNTLESIRARALVLKDRETAEAIEGLGRLYRTLIRCPEVISLQKEVEVLEMYLKLMSLRFADTFVYRVDIEEEAKDVDTIAFWLQPLAENFFNHGMDQESEFNLLMLEAVKKEEGILVTMSDNGRGILEDRLLEIRKNMVEGGDDPGADIGLRNVYMRLSYFYGEAFSMNIKNQAAGGLKIDIFLPALPGKE
ncbi:histidine kinase [Hungatella sp. L12]|uniref:Histidine kinase n=1 Tax=Hungatella hominis TaxID=2763050 RepID=A0ABR7HCS0_9FIRM|nr:histidine kinase [Hungatella hominis]MBC5710931.1 histidine kinase [Hungatella hominis]